MYPNYHVIKRLMTAQARLYNINEKLDNAGVTVGDLGDIDLQPELFEENARKTKHQPRKGL